MGAQRERKITTNAERE